MFRNRLTGMVVDFYMDVVLFGRVTGRTAVIAWAHVMKLLVQTE